MGFFSEMGFILNPSVKHDVDEKTYIETNADTPTKQQGKDTVTINEKGDTVKTVGTTQSTTHTITISNDDTNSIKNPLSSSYNENRQKNPYVKLLEDFHDNDTTKSPAKRLRTSDFIYLRDIGVYPINKMFILKRFDGQTPSYDLNDHDGKNMTMGNATSTVVGWIKDENELFNFNFNEVWKTQSKWIHELLQEIIQQQFGVNIAGIFPIPGWGQSVLFDMMNEMGMTSYDKDHLPFGDPNLLREGVLRETTSTGLASSMSIKLETVYEMKYVNGVDPSIIFNNTIQNLLTMGTSNMNFMLTNNNSIRNLENLFKNPTVDGVIKLVMGFVNKVINAVTSKLNGLNTEYGKQVEKQSKLDAIEAKKAETEKKKHDAIVEIGNMTDEQVVDKNSKSVSKNDLVSKNIDGENTKPRAVTKTERDKAKQILDKEQADKDKESAIKPLVDKAKEKAKNATEVLAKVVEGSNMIKMIKSQLDGVLKATLSRYLQEIKGAINQATGANNTPWHLTIGNPYSPILSMNNIKVSNVDIKLGSELLFNDLPKFIYVTISVEQARNLGKQEMLRMFGVKYKRDYSKAYTQVNSVGDTSGSITPKPVIDKQALKAKEKAKPHNPNKK